jgi:hypothetical protein
MPSSCAHVPVLPPFAWRRWFWRDPKPRELRSSVSLGPGGARVVSLQVRDALRVTCTAGTVWLTCGRDVRDHVLEAGDEHLAAPGDALVLFGMPRATVLLATC